MNLDDELRAELADLSAQSRLRETRPLLGTDRAHPLTLDGTPLLSFCSNDYLGLSCHPALAASFARENAETGFGAAASRLVSGETPAHRALEKTLATFVGHPSALLFATGYETNIGALTALGGPSDLIVSDAANHASIIDGCRLARARVVVYPHLDVAAATAALALPGPFRRRLLVTESLFSMDGDRAPLVPLRTATQKHQALLLVDEAHALGSIGPQGAGLCTELGVRPDVLIGTLGKAFGAQGGFAAGSEPVRHILVNKARTFIYSTGTPPPLAAAAEAAVILAGGPEGDARRVHALRLASHIRLELSRLAVLPPGQDLIIPIILHSDRRALRATAALLERRILIPAIRPPTVPEGTARLRMTVSANHTSSDVDRVLTALAEILPSLPL